MKKLLFALALTISAGTLLSIDASAAPKHRYQPTKTSVIDPPPATPTEEVATADTAGIEAYSDTTSVDDANTSFDNYYEDNHAPHSKYSVKLYDDPFDWVGSIFGTTGLIIIFILFTLLALAPFIVIILIIRYLIKRHNDRVKLEYEAYQRRMQGEEVPPTPSSVQINPLSDEYMVRRGIRNIFIGLGLAVMFTFWDANVLVGVSCLIIFYGLGQCVIALLPTIKKELQERKNRKELM